jgi:hypothetical protein
MRILVNFASRSRPIKMFNCLENLRQYSAVKNYMVLLKLDVDDYSCNNDTVKEQLKYFPEVQTEWGYSESKVAAINRNIGSALEMWDILINFSDDQLFLAKGFDEIIINDMKEWFPDLDGFLHYPDSHAGKKVPVMSIIGRKYFERTNEVYYNKYQTWYADDDAMMVAKKLRKYKFIDTKIYDHFHFRNKKAEMDDLYRRNEAIELRSKDRLIFMERSKTILGS